MKLVCLSVKESRRITAPLAGRLTPGDVHHLGVNAETCATKLSCFNVLSG